MLVVMLPDHSPALLPRVAQAATLLPGLQKDGAWWDSWGVLPCWGGKELHFNIDPEDEAADLAPRQVSILRAMLQHTRDLRSAFEEALFGYYKAEIEGSY